MFFMFPKGAAPEEVKQCEGELLSSHCLSVPSEHSYKALRILKEKGFRLLVKAESWEEKGGIETIVMV